MAVQFGARAHRPTEGG